MFGGDIFWEQIDRGGGAGAQRAAPQRLGPGVEHTCRDKQYERRRKDPDPSFFLHGISFRKGSPYTGETFFNYTDRTGKSQFSGFLFMLYYLVYLN